MRCHRTPKCLTLTHETAELINEIMSLVVFLGMKASTRINNNFWKASLAECLFSNPFAGVFDKTYWHRQIKANWGFVWMHRQASELCDVTGVLKTPIDTASSWPFFSKIPHKFYRSGKCVRKSIFFFLWPCSVQRARSTGVQGPSADLSTGGGGLSCRSDRQFRRYCIKSWG